LEILLIFLNFKFNIHPKFSQLVLKSEKNCLREINYVVCMNHSNKSFFCGKFHIALTKRMKSKYFAINAWFLKLKII